MCASRPAVAEVPSKFVGRWNSRVEEGPGFPWWQQMRYPVRLSVGAAKLTFVDQMGTECEPKTFFYDEELDALIFTHCLSSKSSLTIPPFYRMRIIGDRVDGEVWTYKLLFRWAGERAP
jgi:hypothetical protein